MEFTAKITLDDFISFQRYAVQRINALSAMKMKVAVFSAVYCGLLAVLVVTILYQYYNVNGSERSRLMIAAIIFAAWIAAATIWQRLYFSQFCKEGAYENCTIIGGWRFVANEDGPIEENDFCNSFFHWCCFRSAEEDRHSLYLFTDPLKAVIIPKSQADEVSIAKLKEYVIGKDMSHNRDLSRC